MDFKCVPAVRRDGSAVCLREARQRARDALILREGLPPFDGAVCRHLCENDSMARNGFVCTLHTTWGTHSENMRDRTPERAAAGGKISGPMSKGKKKGPLSEEHKAKIKMTPEVCALGGGANTESQMESRLDVTTRLYTCGCGRTGKGPAFLGKHIKKCLAKLGDNIT